MVEADMMHMTSDWHPQGVTKPYRDSYSQSTDINETSTDFINRWINSSSTVTCFCIKRKSHAWKLQFTYKLQILKTYQLNMSISILPVSV